MNFVLSLALTATLLQGALAQQCLKCAASYADPHIQTFDEASYQCQGQGDFILSKSTKSDFELQARFFVPETGLSEGRNGSSTTGAVFYTGFEGEAKVELQVTPEGFPASSVHDCDIHYYINDERQEFNSFDVFDSENRFYFARRTVEDHAWPYSFRQFQFYDSGAILWASKQFDPIFGCHMNLQLCVPCDFDEKNDMVGLFGSPNGKVKDDFQTRSGDRVKQPPTLGDETNYCHENWCVGKPENSLFLNPDIYHRCTADHETDWDKVIAEVDAEIKKKCEGEVNCILDTLVTGDIDTGLRTLAEAKVMGFVGEIPDPTPTDEVEEDDSYTCTKAGANSRTAFAMPKKKKDGVCFLDDGHSRWGWTLELDATTSKSYEYEVWADAEDCNSNNGVEVGTVTVSYDASTKECKGVYQSTGVHSLQEFQFYCGENKYPTVNNLETTAQSQFSCKHTETETKTSDTCVVENVQAQHGSSIYAIAHAISCDEKHTVAPTESPTSAPTTEDDSEADLKMFNAPPKESKKGSGSGDPHFKTWTGDKYDYHGECDLVLVDHPEFANGLGLRLHIRTTRVKYFSFIEKVALQIGADILEFDNDVEKFLINGQQVEPNRKHHKTMLGDYFVRRDKKAISVRLQDEGNAKIDFHTRKNGFPGVIVDAGQTDIFKGSLGLLGDWETGKKLARDGITEIEVDPADGTPFALEWQVRDTEPMLFKDFRFPQYPSTCTPAQKWAGFRLGHKNMLKEAEEACAHWVYDKEDCIFDVMATRDILVAEEGHIVHIE